MKTKLYRLAWLLAVCLLLCSRTSAWAEYKPLSKEEQEKVNQAIDKGVAYLKRIQLKNGMWSVHPKLRTSNLPSSVFGYTLLPALTLLECGVSKEDVAVQQVAARLRRIHRSLRCTYEVSLAVFFLDRLGEAQDEELIRELALRLIASQCYTGGWNYGCLTLDKDHRESLWKTLQAAAADSASELESRSTLGGKQKPPPPVPFDLRRLAVFRSLNRFDQEADTGDPGDGWSLSAAYTGLTDNSNTQFALLALWAAQRHRVPLERTFRRVVLRFERSQLADGSWSYHFPHSRKSTNNPSSPSMTTVGLLGLAIGHGGLGRDREAHVVGKPCDPQVVKGFTVLSKGVGLPADEVHDGNFGYYLLWSVERVSVLYQIKTIADKDWYRWGVGILLADQKDDGRWPSTFNKVYEKRADSTGATVNSCFALLFLKRTNFTKDLTTRLPFNPEELEKGIVEGLRRPAEGIEASPGSQSKRDR